MPKLFAILAAALLLAACSGHTAPPPASSAPPATRVAPAASTTPAANASAAVTPQVRAAITKAVATVTRGAPVQSIQPSPIPSLFAVLVRGQLLYFSGDGRYMIQGDAFDIATHTQLGQASVQALRREAIAHLSPDQIVRYAPPHPKYTVTVFTDIDCPYCRAFHANIAAINKLGIAVDYLFWPRTGLGTPSAQKAVDVWCAADRKAAMTAAFAGQPVTRAACASPVTRDFNLGVDLGVDGTPTVLAANGVSLGGYVDPDELLRRLEAVHAPTNG